MRGFCFAGFVALSSASYKSLEEVYGPVEKVEQLNPHWGAHSKSAEYMKVRQADNCIFPFELLFVQDSTSSFADDFSNLIETQFPALRDAIEYAHPYTQIALLTFKDKPKTPFGIAPTPENGNYSDYCVRFDIPEFSFRVETLKDTYRNLTANGGGDEPENSFGALLAASQSTKYNWNSDPNAARLIVHITDATPHFYGESEELQAGFKKPTGIFDQDKYMEQCLEEYYPTPQQVKSSIDALGAYTAHLVYDPDYFYGLVGKSWQWFNRFQGQTDDMVNLISGDSTDFFLKLMGIITKLEFAECPALPTARPSTTGTTVEFTGPTTVPAMTTTSKPDECKCPPTHPGCDEAVHCKDGVYINLGFKPDQLDLHVDVAASD